MHIISFQSYALQKYHVFISMMSIFNIQMEWTHENHSCNWAALRKETFLRTKNFLWWRAPESRLFGVKRGKQIASSNQLTSYLTKDSQNWFYKPSFSRKGITYCTFLWKHGTFQCCLKPLESEKYIFTDYYILYHTLLFTNTYIGLGS